MSTIRVNTDRPYDIHIENGAISNIGTYISNLKEYDRVLVVSDDIVFPLYGNRVIESIEKSGSKVYSFVIPSGERNKNMTIALSILDKCAEICLRRNDLLVALGGGVVGDIVGFVASIYKRGIDYVQIPTTLLAQVDSSVGGKTGVDTASGKNLVGTFWQPRMVICDTSMLDTLDKRNISNGIAEIVKYAVIKDPSIIDDLHNNVNMQDIIYKCIAIKRDIVERDERDIGERRLLNFGHTIGHAIEKYCDYRLLHGECVAVGMVIESKLALSLRQCDSEVVDKIASMLKKYDLPVSTNIDVGKLLVYMRSDKKNESDKLTFVLPRELGKCEIVSLREQEIIDNLR